MGTGGIVRVTGPDLSGLVAAVQQAGGSVGGVSPHLTITGLSAAQIGHLAWRNSVELHELATDEAELEHVFLELTTDRRTPPQVHP